MVGDESAVPMLETSGRLRRLVSDGPSNALLDLLIVPTLCGALGAIGTISWVTNDNGVAFNVAGTLGAVLAYIVALTRIREGLRSRNWGRAVLLTAGEVMTCCADQTNLDNYSRFRLLTLMDDAVEALTREGDFQYAELVALYRARFDGDSPPTTRSSSPRALIREGG